MLVDASRRPAPRDEGMTLVEVIVAIAVTVLVLVAAAGALIQIQRAGRMSEGRDRAVQLANDRIEQIRVMPWEQVGFKTVAPTPDAGDPGAGEYGALAPDATGTAPIPDSGTETVTVGANTFTVKTRITWTPSATSADATQPGLAVDNIVNNTGASGTDGVPDDAAKRIAVTVQATLGGKVKTFTAQAIRYPTLDEGIPSITGSGTTRTCSLPSASAFCNATVTTGTVLSGSAGVYKNVVPIVVKATTRAVTSSVTLLAGASSFPLTNPSGDGTTWGTTLPVGTVLPLGTNALTLRNAAGSTQAYPNPAWWTAIGTVPAIAPAVDNAWTGEPGSLRSKSGRTSADTTAPSGSENPTDAYCVNATTGDLWNFQPLFFDVRNSDDQDGPATTEPTVTITGTKDTYATARAITRTLEPQWIGKPSGSVSGTLAANAAGTGYVGTRSTAQGGMNTTRWYAALPPGYPFHPSTARAAVTISMQRPGDGAVMQNAVIVPIKKTTSAAACDVDSPNVPTNVVATGTGTSTTVTWDAVPYATSYKVYRAQRSTPSGTLTWTLATTQTGTSYTYAPGAGFEVSYKIVANNRYGDSPESSVASAVTIPVAPPAPSSTEYGNYWGLYERTFLYGPPAWATSGNLYRSTDGAAAVLQARSGAYGSDWMFSGPQSGLAGFPDPGHNHVYSVEACNAAGCSARTSGTVQRVPFWFGVFDDGAKLHLPLTNTAYGNAGAYTFANLNRDGADMTFGQPSAWQSAPDYSILFAPRALVQWAGAFVTMPAGNAPRTVEWSYKESGGFSAGWIFANIGASALPAAPAPSDGFSAYNRASGVITMNYNMGANAAEWSGLKINDGLWHMYAITYNGTAATLYEDGVSKGARTLTVNTVSNRDHAWNQSSTISGTPDGLSGYYDELIHHSRALTATEIADRWASRADK